MPPHGDYGVEVTRQFVALKSRVRFPIAAQISQPQSESFGVVAVWSGHRKSKTAGSCEFRSGAEKERAEVGS